VTDDHIDFDELAELDEGLLTPERAADVQAHLAGCAECRSRVDAIASTKQALAALPTEPMPEAVQARLDRALPRASTSSSGDVVPNLAEHRRRRFSRPTMAGGAAAAAIVLAFGAIVIGHLGNGTSSGGSEAGGTVANAPDAQRSVLQPKNYVRTSSGVNYTPTNLKTLIPGLVAGAEFSPSASTSEPPVPAASGSNATTHPQNLANQPVPAVLRPLYDSRTSILRCAATLTGIPNAVPIAVDFGRWTNPNAKLRNAPSAIFVFRAADPNAVDVWVVNPSCSGNLLVRTDTKVPLN